MLYVVINTSGTWLRCNLCYVLATVHRFVCTVYTVLYLHNTIQDKATKKAKLILFSALLTMNCRCLDFSFSSFGCAS